MEAQVSRDAKDARILCQTDWEQFRLGCYLFIYFGDKPSTSHAYVFAFPEALYKVRSPTVQLQEHVKQLSSLR